MRNAIEEIVHLNVPLRAFTCYVNEDINVTGTLLKKGTHVLVVFGTANKDAKRFPKPHRFNIERNTIGNVGFGQGVHVCLRMNLTRL